MSSRHRLSRKNISPHLADTNLWPSVDLEALGTEEKPRFVSLKTSIQRYLEGDRVASIQEAYGFTSEQIQRALERCCAMHIDGRPWGWRALIKGIRVKPFERRLPPVYRDGSAGYAGALCRLLKLSPEIKDEFEKYLLTARAPGSRAAEAKVVHSAALEHFLSLCRKNNVPTTQWPFVVKQRGKSAVRNYVNRFFQEHYDQIVARQHGEAAATKSRTGTGTRSRFSADCPFDAVEIDEHKAHFIGTVGIDTPSGRVWVPISRVIVITVTDRRSAVVLGYSVAFRDEATADDVMMAIHNALTPCEPRKFSLAGLSYGEGDGFLGSRDTTCAGLAWCAMMLDGALVHLAHEITGRVRDAVGCDINLGPSKSPARRAVGERIFKQLTDRGFVRLPSTTGTNTADPSRQQPEKKAVAMRLEARSILDLIELAIASENGQPSTRVHGLKKLVYVEEFLKDPTLQFLRPRLPTRPDHIPDLKTLIYNAKITGSQQNGVRPRIYALNTHYISKEWKGRWDLIGKDVRIHFADREDVRTLKAYSLKGDELGVAECAEDWSDVPHSYSTRELVSALIRTEKLKRLEGESYMTAFLRSLKEQAEKDARIGASRSRAGTRLARHRRGSHDEPPAQVPPAANDEVNATSCPPPAETAGVGTHLDLEGLVLPRGFKALNT